MTTLRISPGAVRGSSATAAEAAASGRPTSAPFSSAAQPGDVGLGQHLAEVDDALVHPPGVGDEHQHQPGRGERDELEVPDGRAGERRVLDDGDLPGELGEQPDAAAQHVVEVHRAVEERLHGAALGRRERLDLRKPVDEQPVALVRGDTTGARVRLRDQSLVLQQGHVVADRCARHPEIVPVDDHLGADGLLGAHVVRDDRAKHREPTLLGVHLHLPRMNPAGPV